ncbi:MAG: PaaI family thioesterase [Sphingomonadales bacterium]|jgi:acyl-CoA thioesterase|nr:PaaI family thioesterase [Sphingomonadales bacterium]MBK9004093.1 PaaI family thioesterase [Sphingomonadales bacterium]MBK9269269.1 PaaI family thioesterase [Sphingomonadales bacterium]MBP6435387.1 PaaI family thioesterase [Sphingorhabdus sp.]
MASRPHPFADLIGLAVAPDGKGGSTATLTAEHGHMNPHGVVHGAVIYALADTGMGAALYPSLDAGQACATIEIKISYFRPVAGGEIRCTTQVDNKGRSIAHLTSRIEQGEKLVALATGSFAILAAPPGKA